MSRLDDSTRFLVFVAVVWILVLISSCAPTLIDSYELNVGYANEYYYKNERQTKRVMRRLDRKGVEYEADNGIIRIFEEDNIN